MAPRIPDGTVQEKVMEVRIAGFHGLHSLKTGVAYWYRGRHLYTAAGISVEPAPWNTKYGIIMVRQIIDTTPPPHPRQEPSSRYESEVSALYKSMLSEWAAKEQARKSQGENDTANVVATEAQTVEIQGLTPGGQGTHVSQGGESSQWLLDRLWNKDEMIKNEAEGRYNGRALFLAQSAPGSHRGTPSISRATSPRSGASRAVSPDPFPKVGPSSRLRSLLENAPIIEGPFASHQRHAGKSGRSTDPTEQLTDVELLGPIGSRSYLLKKERDPSTQTMSRNLSGFPRVDNNMMLHSLPSRPLLRKPSRPGLQDNTELLFTPGTSSQSSAIRVDSTGPSMLDLVEAQKSANRSSRARSDSMKAASLALNAAINDHDNIVVLVEGKRESVENLENREKTKSEERVGKTKKVDNDGKFQKTEKPETVEDVEGSVLKCCIHGGDCDGVTTTDDHVTLQKIKTVGLKEGYLMAEEREAGK